MKSRSLTRLDLHRLKFKSGKTTERLSFFALDDVEKKIVADDVFSKIYLNRDNDPYVIYSYVLEDWGVACPHPQHLRLYEGVRLSHFPEKESKWYSCSLCRCTVINSDRDDGSKLDKAV